MPDLVKEQSREGYVLRQACRQAREIRDECRVKIISWL